MLIFADAIRRERATHGADVRRAFDPRHFDAIRNFLAMCDPNTGYLEDDSDDDGSDDVH